MESSEAEFVGSWNEKKLELRLGPPGEEEEEEEEENWSMEAPPVKEMDIHESLLSLGGPLKINSFWMQQQQQPKLSASFLHLSESCATEVLDFHNPEKKAPAKPAMPSNSQKRRTDPAPAPVVGWPPIRSSRRNLASKQPPPEFSEPNAVLHKAGTEAASGNGKGLFVKINMDGVPIGRKVDLKAYDSYAKLSAAVDELFTGLLAAQADSFAGETANKESRVKEITGILDESGEYTLVYEDNEGDRMLVGDVPWHMFVSTVKRLRVLKSSDVSALSRKSGSGSGSAPPYQS